MEEFYHKPVMLNECLDGLNIRPDGAYLDCTLGGGGHSAEILKRLADGRVIGIDRDEDAIRYACARIAQLPNARNFTAVRGNFHDAREILDELGIRRVDGVLIDLGVSSRQLDDRERGFSYQGDARLDMRMDRDQPLSARTIVNEWAEKDIARALYEYGEESWAARIAKVICERRAVAPIETTRQLVDIIDAAIPKKVRSRDDSHPARRTFQALRIAVNDELAPLAGAIDMLARLLTPGGRLCAMAFHSLEDRIVKTTLRELENPCTCPRQFPVCVCGKRPVVRVITKKPVTAGAEEISENARAHSATLRIAEAL